MPEEIILRFLAFFSEVAISQIFPHFAWQKYAKSQNQQKNYSKFTSTINRTLF